MTTRNYLLLWAITLIASISLGLWLKTADADETIAELDSGATEFTIPDEWLEYDKCYYVSAKYDDGREVIVDEWCPTREEVDEILGRDKI